MSSVSQLTVITEHPIPIDEGRAEDLQHSNPMFEEDEEEDDQRRRRTRAIDRLFSSGFASGEDLLRESGFEIDD